MTGKFPESHKNPQINKKSAPLPSLALGTYVSECPHSSLSFRLYLLILLPDVLNHFESRSQTTVRLLRLCQQRASLLGLFKNMNETIASSAQ